MIVVIINGQFLNYHIAPLTLVLAGIGTFVSGAMMRFMPLKVGGIIMWAAAAWSFHISETDQLLVNAATVAIAYLIPGYIMRSQFRKHGI